MKKKLLVGIATGLLLIGSQVAQADTIELALVLDGSGSISNGDWALQLGAYKNIFSNSFATTYLNGNTLVVGAYQFSSDVTQFAAWTTINTNADALAFSNYFTSVTQKKDFTATGDAIATATNGMLTNGKSSDRMVIDVSTDGYSNEGVNVITAATNAYAQGVTTNALGVGSGVNISELNNMTLAGHGFYMLAPNFTAFQQELEKKLHTEINPVPEPAAMFLFGAGLAGLAAVGRRRKTN